MANPYGFVKCVKQIYFYISIAYMATVVILRYPCAQQWSLSAPRFSRSRDITLTCIERLVDAHSLGGVCAAPIFVSAAALQTGNVSQHLETGDRVRPDRQSDGVRPWRGRRDFRGGASASRKDWRSRPANLRRHAVAGSFSSISDLGTKWTQGQPRSSFPSRHALSTSSDRMRIKPRTLDCSCSPS